jgi:hypothetical protein
METLRALSTSMIFWLIIACIAAGIAFAFYRRKEGFQDVAADTTVKLSRESCIPLKSQIDQYKKVREDHKDIMIVDLDTTIEKLEKYYKTYGCDT